MRLMSLGIDIWLCFLLVNHQETLFYKTIWKFCKNWVYRISMGRVWTLWRVSSFSYSHKQFVYSFKDKHHLHTLFRDTVLCAGKKQLHLYSYKKRKVEWSDFGEWNLEYWCINNLFYSYVQKGSLYRYRYKIERVFSE